jgi:hypothetical protein
MAFHDLVLSLDGRGGWEIQRGQRARRRAGPQTGVLLLLTAVCRSTWNLLRKHGRCLGLDVFDKSTLLSSEKFSKLIMDSDLVP